MSATAATASATDPIAAIATAPGRGAVGIVRVSGRGTLALAPAICARPLAPRVATFGAFRDADGSAIDRGLAIAFPAPHSYTGEDVLELHAHGGPVVLQLLLARCLSAAAEVVDGRPRLPGLRLARPGEFTERAFLNGKLDLAQAEAVMDLIDAGTEAAARSASRALAGALSQRVHALAGPLTELRALVEATLDFPEEELDAADTHEIRTRLDAIAHALADVQRRTRTGALLQGGLKVVIAGAPNAGKSSLLNALAGAELAIVTPIAGTTRDAVQQSIQIEGVPLHVLDTAGLRDDGADEVERIGIARAWQHIAEADAVLLVHDLTRPDSSAGIAARIAQHAGAHVPILHIANKRDAAPAAPLPAPHAIAISALHGEGLDALRARLLQLAGWSAEGGDTFTARQRHVQALQGAAAHLEAAQGQLAAPELLAEELRLAHRALASITGEVDADALLGEIFARFCIGK